MLTVENLQLVAAKRVLVDALHFTVQPGECWCVIGRNGAGKSTLLRTLAGLQRPAAGHVMLAGRDLARHDPATLARLRAWLPQGRQDAFGFRALDMVLAARHPYQAGRFWESADDLADARHALAQMDVEDLAERDLRALSGGERQRVAIAATLAQNTPLLLLDEPTAALDLAHQVAVMTLLRDLCRNARKSVVMVVHDLNLAQSAASHVLLMLPDGRWHAGPAGAMLREDLLTACLGFPVRVLLDGQQRVFLPRIDVDGDSAAAATETAAGVFPDNAA